MPKRAHEPVDTGQPCAEPCCVRKTRTVVSSFLTAMTLLSTAQAVPQDVGQSMQKVVDQEAVEDSAYDRNMPDAKTEQATTPK